MIDLNPAQLSAWLAAFLWPFFRLAGMVGTAPLFSESTIPRRVKMLLAALLAVVVAPTLDARPAISLYSTEGLLVLGSEVGIGMATGFAMRLVFTTVQFAGDLIGLQMGLSFASFFDRSAGGQTMVLARVLNIVAMLLFLAMDGHLLMLAAVVDGFHALPIGAVPLSAQGWQAMARAGGAIFSSGLLLALPMIAVLLTLNLSMGILNRSAPQLSIFAVGFPVTLAGGLIVLMMVTPQMGTYLRALIEAGLGNVQAALGAFLPWSRDSGA